MKVGLNSIVVAALVFYLVAGALGPPEALVYCTFAWLLINQPRSPRLGVGI